MIGSISLRAQVKKNKSNSPLGTSRRLPSKRQSRSGVTSITPSNSIRRGSHSTRRASSMLMRRVTLGSPFQSSASGTESRMRGPTRSLRSTLMSISYPRRTLHARYAWRQLPSMMISSRARPMGNSDRLSWTQLPDRPSSMSLAPVVLNSQSLSSSQRVKV